MSGAASRRETMRETGAHYLTRHLLAAAITSYVILHVRGGSTVTVTVITGQVMPIGWSYLSTGRGITTVTDFSCLVLTQRPNGCRRDAEPPSIQCGLARR